MIDEITIGRFAIVSFSTLSNAAVTGMIIWILIQKHPNQTVSRLVLNMLFSDWLQSVGFMMSLRWIASGDISPGAFCSVQGIIINIGDVASGFWATAICLHTYMAVVHSFEAKHYLLIAMTLIWPFNIFIAVVGFLLETPEVPFFGSAGGAWCWIAAAYPGYRILFHYGIITILAFIMILLYGTMFIMIYRHQGSIQMSNTKVVLQRTGKKLIYYPISYILLVFPLAFQRYIAVLGIHFPLTYLLTAGCIFTSAGLVNSIIYGFTRNVVAMKPLFEREFDEKAVTGMDGLTRGPNTILGGGTTPQLIFVNVSAPSNSTDRQSLWQKNSDFNSSKLEQGSMNSRATDETNSRDNSLIPESPIDEVHAI
ncbi:hypothetical protein G9A89_006208 [Geosiphon pyriformis]|nr:hypothetical protein G9A89_006208 [Geosiphon pyriformis]